MSLLFSLKSLLNDRRNHGRAKRVSWPRPTVEELEPRWVPAGPPGVGVGTFAPGSVGGGAVPAVFASGQTSSQTAALNPPVPNNGTAVQNAAGTVGGAVAQNGVVTNPALVAQSIILNRVPIMVTNLPVNFLGTLPGTTNVLPTVSGTQSQGVSNANPLLLARTARLSGSGNDFATLFATDSELFRRGLRDFLEGLPGSPPARSQSALPQSLQEPTQVADEVSQRVRQQPASPDQKARALAFLARGGSIVELAAMLSNSDEGLPDQAQLPADDTPQLAGGDW